MEYPRSADVAHKYGDPNASRINSYMIPIRDGREPREDLHVTDEEFINWFHRNHGMISTEFGRSQHNAVKDVVRRIIDETNIKPNPKLPKIKEMETILQLLDRQPVEEAKASAASAASETPSAQAAMRLTKLISEKCNTQESKQAMDDLAILIDAATRNKGGSRRRRASKKHSKKHRKSKRSKKTKSRRH
jgi:hypothetical protein